MQRLARNWLGSQFGLSDEGHGPAALSAFPRATLASPNRTTIAFVPSVQGISENVIAGLLGLLILAGATWGVSHVDAPIALWAVFVIGVGLGLLGFVAGRAPHHGDDLLGYQADLLGEAVLALRDLVAGKLNVPFEDFMERGVLAPARFGLSVERNEEIRLSVLVPDGDTLRMIFESGHSLGRKDDFSLPRASLAGHALETGELQWTNDVDNDQRWYPHPKASAERGYGSLASTPIVVGDDAVGVLNVVSSAKGAFLKGDLTYVELLGGFIGLAWALNDGSGALHRLASSEESKASERKGT